MEKGRWESFVDYVAEGGEKNKFITSMLRQMKLEKIEGNSYTVICANPITYTFISKKITEIEILLHHFTGNPATVTLTIEEKRHKAPPPTPLLQFVPSTDDALSRSGIRSRYNFDNFAVSSSNQVAYAAAQAVADNPGVAYNPLFLYGGVGVGKTHLTQAIARKMLENDFERKILFSPCDMFINELIEAIRERNTGKFRRKFRPLQLLIVDDIQFIAGKQTMQEELFHTFNAIISTGGQIVLTSDTPPEKIKNLEDRLRSRFSGGLMVDVQDPDFELRTAILLIKAKEKNIIISMEAAKIIADTISDTRALEGALLTLYARTLGVKEEIGLEEVEDFFHKNSANKPKMIPPYQEVIKTVCSFYNIKVTNIKSSDRSERLSFPRQIAMYILREHYRFRLEHVAEMLKKKDHTTIIHGVEKIKQLLMKDQQVKNEVDKIIQTVESSS